MGYALMRFNLRGRDADEFGVHVRHQVEIEDNWRVEASVCALDNTAKVAPGAKQIVS